MSSSSRQWPWPRQHPKVRAGWDMQGWLAPPLLRGVVDQLARGAEHEFNRLAAEGSRLISQRKEQIDERSSRCKLQRPRDGRPGVDQTPAVAERAPDRP